jgi:hypothetical protein
MVWAAFIANTKSDYGYSTVDSQDSFNLNHLLFLLEP